MCGIAGIIGGDPQAIRPALAAMNAAQRHRGPDDTGSSILPFGSLVLGLDHRRLSILDLSPAGHQPMIHPGTGDQIIFNGEIYNFARLREDLLSAGESFKGHSDTEVMLHGLSRHGPDYIKQLEGMFAFAFYNAREQTLLLARDSVGIKPLYIARTGGALLFASEVRAILATGMIERKLDMQGVAGLLAYGAVQSPCTIFQNIRVFPAGAHELFRPGVEPGRGSPIRYWSIPRVKEAPPEVELIQQIRRTMEASVRDHLVADVPVGVFLSSGLDSTIVAGLGGKLHPRLRSFTVGFADQPDLSEQEFATRTAAEFGLQHTPITINNSDAQVAAAQWLQSLDQPSMDGLNVYVISKAVREQGITVALSGQGGDELFGGYPSFRDVPRLARMMHRVRWMPRAMRALAGSIAGLGKSRAVREKLRDIACTDGSLREIYFQRRRAMSDGQLASLGLRAEALGLAPSFHVPEALADVPVDETDPIATVSWLESIFYQGNMLLRDGDANGMAHSLEIRVPMLDQRMLDLVLPLPGEARLPPGGASKHLLRVAFAQFLRPELMTQRKMGFTLPIRRWMQGPLRETCEAAIAHLKSMQFLNPPAVEQIWRAFLREPETPIWSRALTLCVLGVYLRQMRS